jgi:hypothetical protein
MTDPEEIGWSLPVGFVIINNYCSYSCFNRKSTRRSLIMVEKVKFVSVSPV